MLYNTVTIFYPLKYRRKIVCCPTAIFRRQSFCFASFFRHPSFEGCRFVSLTAGMEIGGFLQVKNFS